MKRSLILTCSVSSSDRKVQKESGNKGDRTFKLHSGTTSEYGRYTETTCDLPPGVGPSVPVVVLSSAGKTSNTAQFAYLDVPPTEVPGLSAMMQALLALLFAMLGVQWLGRTESAKD